MVPVLPSGAGVNQRAPLAGLPHRVTWPLTLQLVILRNRRLGYLNCDNVSDPAFFHTFHEPCHWHKL